MHFFFAFLGFLVIFVLLGGVVVFLLSDARSKRKTSEWPVLVETEHSHQIHTLKGFLEEEDIPIIVEDESPEVGGIPTSLTRNRIRVQPGNKEKAIQRIRDSDINLDNIRLKNPEP